MMLCGVGAVASAQLLRRKALAIRPCSGKAQSPHNSSRPSPARNGGDCGGLGEGGEWGEVDGFDA